MGIIFHGVGAATPPGQPAEFLEIHDGEEYQSDSVDGEQLIRQYAVNFNVVSPSVLHMKCNIAAFTKTTGNRATYNIKIGGNYGSTNGTTVVSMVTGNATYQDTPDCLTGDTFDKPSGCQLVKLTMIVENTKLANIQGTGITFVSA